MTRAAGCIVAEPTGVSRERGQSYRILHAGGVLIEHTWSPEHDSARALLAKGIRGRVEMWRPGKPHADAIVDIERAARLTIRENDKRGPEAEEWKPFASSAVTPQAVGLDQAATQGAVDASRLPETSERHGNETAGLRLAARR